MVVREVGNEGVRESRNSALCKGARMVRLRIFCSVTNGSMPSVEGTSVVASSGGLLL